MVHKTMQKQEESPITPRLLDHFSKAVELLQTPRAALFTDLDGTLSELVQRPEEATLSPDVREALESLHHRLPLVAIISGRAARDALAMVGLPQLTYVGNHGMERIEGGQHQVAEGFRPYLPEVRTAVQELRSTITTPGVWLEDKELSLSIHYRHARKRNEAYRQICQALSDLSNRGQFRAIEGKELVDLVPALGASKGTAVCNLVAQYRLSGALFMGDDITDVDAFRSIRVLRRDQSFRGINVAVLGREARPEVARESDFTLCDVAEATRFLTRLADTLA